MTALYPLTGAVSGVLGFGDSLFGELVDMFSDSGDSQPSYRTEPIPGAELGGRPRNPEDDVIDEIDRLVAWQLENGTGR